MRRRVVVFGTARRRPPLLAAAKRLHPRLVKDDSTHPIVHRAVRSAHGQVAAQAQRREVVPRVADDRPAASAVAPCAAPSPSGRGTASSPRWGSCPSRSRSGRTATSLGCRGCFPRSVPSTRCRPPPALATPDPRCRPCRCFPRLRPPPPPSIHPASFPSFASSGRRNDRNASYAPPLAPCRHSSLTTAAFCCVPRASESAPLGGRGGAKAWHARQWGSISLPHRRRPHELRSHRCRFGVIVAFAAVVVALDSAVAFVVAEVGETEPSHSSQAQQRARRLTLLSDH